MKRIGLVLGFTLLISGCEITFQGGPSSAEFTMAAGGVVSIIAMFLYYRYRRSGEPSSFKRFATFITGLPVTFLIMLTVQEDPEEVFRRIDGDDDSYDLARLEHELAAFRAHKESVEREPAPSPLAPPPRTAPPPRKGLASTLPDAEPGTRQGA